MLKFRLVSTLGFLLVTACSVPKPEPREGAAVDNASYFIAQGTIKQTQTQIHNDITLPIARIYNLEVCFKDNKLGRPIENHSFNISMMGEEKSLTSNASGCVDWLQKVPFNFLAPAKWVTLGAKITAHGFHQGQRNTSFAINPWEEKAEILLNQKIENLIPESQTLETLQAASNEGLWLDDLRVVISEKTVGSELQLEIKGTPSLMVTKLDGKKIPDPISKGEFLMDLTLLNVGQKTQILSQAKDIQAEVIGGGLAFKNPVILPLSGTCSLGHIELAIKLTAKVNDPQLKSFEGVYSNLGECDQLKGGFFAKLKTSFTANNSQVKSLTDYIQDNHLLKSTSPASAVAIAVRELTPSNVGFTGSLNLNKSKSFSITACMMRPLDRKPVPFQKFEIKKINGTTETRQTLTSGCMTWDDSISFNLLDQECWTRKSFTISSAELKYSQALEIDINPWDEGPASIRDARKGEASLTCPVGKSKIVLQSYDFDLMGEGISHEIDKYLNIKLRKNGVLRLPGRLVRPTAKNMQGLEDIPLPAGKYTLRWAIIDSRVKNFLTDPAKAANYIYQAQELPIEIDAAGTMTQPITFESFDTKSVGNLNHILFELEPSEAHKNFTPQTFMGSILLSDRKEPGTLKVVASGKSLIKELIQQFNIDRKKMQVELDALTTKQSFATNKKMQLINLNDESGSLAFRTKINMHAGLMQYTHQSVNAYPTANLKQWINSGNMPQEMASRLCSFWIYGLAGKNSSPLSLSLARSYLHCKNDLVIKGNKYLEIDYVYFMKSVNLLRELEPSYDMKQLTSGYMVNFSADDTVTKSVDINAGFNTGRWFSPFSLGGGGRIQWATSERKGLVNAGANQTAKQLQIEVLSFELQSNQYEKCMSIKVSPKIAQKYLDLIPEENKSNFFSGLLICNGEVSHDNKIFIESYTVINQILFAAHMSNPASQKSRNYFMAIRGLSEYERFLDSLSMAIAQPETASTDFFAKKSLDHQFRKLFEDRGLSMPGVYIGKE